MTIIKLKNITVCKLFVLRIVTWSYNCLLKIIINYLKLFNFLQIIGVMNT